MYYVGCEETSDRAKAFKIPFLEGTNFIPQGLHKTTFNQKEYWLITAYDGLAIKNSRIYVVSTSGEHLKTLEIENSHNAHFGGITEYKDEIWIVSTRVMYQISKDKIFNTNGEAKDIILISDYKKHEKGILKYDESITPQGSLSFCTNYPLGDVETLWIGTYDSEKDSYAYGYQYNEDETELINVAIMPIPASCQGMTFVNEENVLCSTSDNYKNSKTYLCNYEWTTKNNFYKYEENNREIVLTPPALAQEIYLDIDDSIYILFESGAKKYKQKAAGLASEYVYIYDYNQI